MTKTWAWLGIAIGFVLWQVSVISLTIRGVEADLLRQDGTPPLWQPVLFVVSSAIIVIGVVVLIRGSRSRRISAR